MGFCTFFHGEIEKGFLSELVPLLESTHRSPMLFRFNGEMTDDLYKGEGIYHFTPLFPDEFGHSLPFRITLKRDDAAFRMNIMASVDAPPTQETLNYFKPLMKALEIFSISRYHIISDFDKEFLVEKSFGEPDHDKIRTIKECERLSKRNQFYYQTILHYLPMSDDADEIFAQAHKIIGEYVEKRLGDYERLNRKFNGLMFGKSLSLVYPYSEEIYEKYLALLDCLFTRRRNQISLEEYFELRIMFNQSYYHDVKMFLVGYVPKEI